jgi:hypothetical protein
MRTSAIIKRAFLGNWRTKEANLLALIYPNRGKKANIRDHAGLHFPGTRAPTEPVRFDMRP